MENLNDLVKELAKIYNIEVVDTPNQHTVETKKGEILLLDNDTLLDAFGITIPQSIKKVAFTFKGQPSHNGTFVETGENVNNDSIDTLKNKKSVENYKYAIAA